jgi:hypothetical protein
MPEPLLPALIAGSGTVGLSAALYLVPALALSFEAAVDLFPGAALGGALRQPAKKVGERMGGLHGRVRNEDDDFRGAFPPVFRELEAQGVVLLDVGLQLDGSHLQDSLHWSASIPALRRRFACGAVFLRRCEMRLAGTGRGR